MKLLAVAGGTRTGPMVNFLAPPSVCVRVYICVWMCVCVCLAISRFDQIFKANEQDGHTANFGIKQRTKSK